MSEVLWEFHAIIMVSGVWSCIWIRGRIKYLAYLQKMLPTLSESRGENLNSICTFVSRQQNIFFSCFYVSVQDLDAKYNQFFETFKAYCSYWPLGNFQ